MQTKTTDSNVIMKYHMSQTKKSWNVTLTAPQVSFSISSFIEVFKVFSDTREDDGSFLPLFSSNGISSCPFRVFEGLRLISE